MYQIEDLQTIYRISEPEKNLTHQIIYFSKDHNAIHI